MKNLTRMLNLTLYLTEINNGSDALVGMRERKRERGRERTLRWADQTIEYVRQGPVNRQESWEMLLASRTAHSISQFKAQHIQLNPFYKLTKVC